MTKPRDPKKIQPWERQYRESTKAFEAFALYRDMGADRSLSKVEEKLEKSHTLIGRWSSRWKWVDRTLAWDGRIDEEKRNSQMEAIAQMTERHAHLAEAGLAAIRKISIEFIERVQKGSLDKENVSDDELRAIFMTAMTKMEPLTRVERQARGLPELWLMIGQMNDDQLEAFVVSLLAEGQTTGAGAGLGGTEAEGLATALADLRQDGE